MPELRGIIWEMMTAEHITEVVRLLDDGEAPLPKAAAKGIKMLVEGRSYPAKHVVRLAYCLARGVPLTTKVEFASGKGLVDNLERLGFEVDYNKGPSPKKERTDFTKWL